MLDKLICFCSLLDKIQPRVSSYEEQVTTVREHLATLLEKEEDWSKAAQTLAGIDLDSGELMALHDPNPEPFCCCVVGLLSN